MHRRYLILILLFATTKIFAQQTETDITGLWKGTLYNDTTQQFYKYEIGISQEKGKLSGFSHTWFMLEEKQYFGIKKLKIKQQDGKIIIEDDGLIANNYPVAPAKGVRQLNILTLNISDSITTLSGSFTTNATKTFRPLTGTINLERKSDYRQSALVPHLQELNLANKLSFVKEEVLLAKNDLIIDAKQNATKAFVELKTTPSTKKIRIKDIDSSPIKNSETATAKVYEAIKANTIKEPKDLTVNKSDTVYSIAVSVKKVDKATQSFTPITKVAEVTTTIIQPIKIERTAPAFDVQNRTTLLQQTVTFKSDSLQISLYDNGEVDGDTVSVLMNGNIIMAKERLSTNAVRRTIYIPQNTDTVQLVMYAENLGTIPPNTGLLVVKDGKDLYEIRFSGDLQKNAAIIFKRKK